MTDSKKASDLKAMKLAKNYHPMGDFLIEEVDEDGKVTLREPDERDGLAKDADGKVSSDSLKIKADTVIHVPIEEARRMNKLGIAVRNDDF